MRRLKSRFERGSGAVPDPAPVILAVTADPGIATALRQALQPLAWPFHTATSLEAGLELGRRVGSRCPFNTILLDKTLVASDWRSAVARLAQLPVRPSVLLIGQEAGPMLSESVTLAGGYAVLAMPINPESAAHSIYAGWLLWSNQDHLRRLTK